MINIEVWMKEFLKELDATFGNRIWFVGLQGSYGRNEATEESDIDMVVILNTVSCSDIEIYNAIITAVFTICFMKRILIF